MNQVLLIRGCTLNSSSLAAVPQVREPGMDRSRSQDAGLAPSVSLSARPPSSERHAALVPAFLGLRGQCAGPRRRNSCFPPTTKLLLQSQNLKWMGVCISHSTKEPPGYLRAPRTVGGSQRPRSEDNHAPCHPIASRVNHSADLLCPRKSWSTPPPRGWSPYPILLIQVLLPQSHGNSSKIGIGIILPLIVSAFPSSLPEVHAFHSL